MGRECAVPAIDWQNLMIALYLGPLWRKLERFFLFWLTDDSLVTIFYMYRSTIINGEIDMEVSTIATHQELFDMQFLVKQLGLNSFRIVDEFPMFNGDIQIRYEIIVDEYNRLQRFMNKETPKPLTCWVKFKRWLKR